LKSGQYVKADHQMGAATPGKTGGRAE